ncbi:hypothetical protein PWT90_04685 [Aphanocladium album]|nr:hypothetical protein PWT90_04685 [Aphanocladium album]
MRVDAALLLVAAFVASPISALARNVPTTLSTTKSTSRTRISSKKSSSRPSPGSHSTSRSTTTRSHNTTSQSTTSTSTTVSLSSSISATGHNTTTSVIPTTTAEQNATEIIPTGNPSPPPNLPPGYTVTRLPCNATKTSAGPHAKPKSKAKCKGGSMISIVPVCTPLASSKTFTQYMVVHTSTVTFMGNRSDYTPPFAPLATPNYCNPNVYPAVPRLPDPESSWNGFMDPDPTMITEIFTIEGQSITAEFPIVTPAIARVPVTTFITTDKNPSVVFPSDPIPGYSQTWSVGGGNGNGYHTPVGGGGAPAPVTVVPSYTITAGPTSVVINSQTFTVGPGSRSTVTVDGGGVFTIEPTAVVGQGASITRPPSVLGPSSSVLDGIPVTSAGPNLEIGGGTFAIPTSGPKIVQVNGKAVTINPTGVTIGGDSMGFLRPAPSDVIVAGGEMLTAIGRSVVVLHSITYTYGSGIAPVVQVINGDTIAIESTGVLVHGSTLGGVSAQPTDTEYEIVGGATIAKIPPSMVIVNGETYAVGPGANMKTIVIGDQTITMGPVGLVMATTTMKFPFDASVTTTIAGRATGDAMPQETGTGEEDAAFSVRPDVRVGLTCLCIVFGVLVLG